MKYFLDLPDYFKNFINHKNDIDKLIDNKSEHDWMYFPTTYFVNDEGFNWFRSRNLQILKVCLLFNSPKLIDTYANIHIDTMNNDNLNNYAINYVLLGSGEMQWVKIDGTPEIREMNSSYFYGYKNTQSVEILDKWSGSIGLVKINIPHRVVTTDSRRICLSLRFHKKCSLEDFEKFL